MSKKRKYLDGNKNDFEEPALKKMKLDESFNPFDRLTVPELKKEIKKRDKKQKVSKLRKSELTPILFELTRLSPSKIDKLKKQEIVDELKMYHEYQDRKSWKKKDLAEYLKYINANPKVVEYGYNYNDNTIDDTKEISKEEFIQIPLYKMHQIYQFSSHQTNRDKMYNDLQRRWKYQQQAQQHKNKLFEPIINRFFNKNNNVLSIKQEIIDYNDKVLVLHDLNSGDRRIIHEFAEKHGLFSSSFGARNQFNTLPRMLCIGRECDRSQVFQVGHAQQIKINQQIEKQKNNAWNGMIEKNALLKQQEEKNNNNNNNTWNICGEWVMNEDNYYLYLNKFDGDVFGSFLIGAIEGKLRLKTNGRMIDNLNKKFVFEWRGRETGEGVIQIGDNKVGEIEFNDLGTSAIGVLQSDYGNFRFHALRISGNVKMRATRYDFEYDEEEEYESQRINRWH